MRFLRTKITWVIPLVCCCFTAAAQQDAIAAAEQSFAQMAKDSGTKKAFLHFLDSNGIVFSRGQSQEALPFWNNMPNDMGVLFWKPVYTGMAASGEIGFSTGPFEHRNAPGSAINASGSYSSIWVKNKQGAWKLLIDLGMPYTPSLFQKDWAPAALTGLSPAADNKSWRQVELHFITRYRQKGYRAFLPYITGKSWFNIMDHSPLHTVTDIETGLQQLPPDLQFQYLGGAVSAAGDLFYAYGVVIRNGNKENYLRVWGHEKNGWKLLLQVLRWVR
jgi:hypothetical protein